jgi:putative acetyltransferase
MTIRSARESDIAALAAIATRSYRRAFANILEASALAKYDEAFFRDRFAGCWPGTRLLVARDDIVGFCTMTDSHIDMIFLDPGSMGRGHGRALLNDAESRGARSLECFAMNKQACAFYEARGWRMTRRYSREFAGRQRDFVWFEKDRGD